MATPAIHTYHCLCTSLLLATTHSLSTLPRRTGLDSAIILPMPASPPQLEPESSDIPSEGYTLLLSLTPDPARRPTNIRREDGFEKRYLYRCGRCRLVVGYELDESHYCSAEKETEAEGENGGAGAEAERTKILYLLPNGITSTDVMASGRKINEEDVTLGEKGRNTVAAWE